MRNVVHQNSSILTTALVAQEIATTNMKLNKIDYKGKHFVLQDANIALDYEFGFDFVTGTMDSSELTPEFVAEHKDACDYYGIPCYFGRDKEINKLFN